MFLAPPYKTVGGFCALERVRAWAGQNDLSYVTWSSTRRTRTSVTVYVNFVVRHGIFTPFHSQVHTVPVIIVEGRHVAVIARPSARIAVCP